jgi:hypothetical protein
VGMPSDCYFNDVPCCLCLAFYGDHGCEFDSERDIYTGTSGSWTWCLTELHNNKMCKDTDLAYGGLDSATRNHN